MKQIIQFWNPKNNNLNLKQLKIKIKSNPTRNKAMSMLNIFRYSACLKRPLYYSGKCLKHINQTQTEKNPSETQPSILEWRILGGPPAGLYLLGWAVDGALVRYSIQYRKSII